MAGTTMTTRGTGTTDDGFSSTAPEPRATDPAFPDEDERRRREQVGLSDYQIG